MKKYLLLIACMCAYILNAQNNFNDYIWTYDANGNIEKDWKKPVWLFSAQNGSEPFLSPFYQSKVVFDALDNGTLLVLSSLGITREGNINDNVASLAFGIFSDFHESDGWRLLSVDLGSSTEEYNFTNLDAPNSPRPYVAFYNVERGIIRVFFRERASQFDASNNVIVDKAVIELKTNSNNNTGILSTLTTGAGNDYTSQFIVALDKRDTYSKSNGMIKYIGKYDGNWVVADF